MQTDGGAWRARNVLIATGDCDVPRFPRPAATAPAGVVSLHSSGYKAPEKLAPGGVLVVGAGPSGQQIALELGRAGRDVVLAVGRHSCMVRSYRGHHIWHWLSATGQLDQRVDEIADPEAARRSPPFALTGARGGEQLDLDVLRAAGVELTGRLERFSGAQATFAGDLAGNVVLADRRMRRVLADIDHHIARAAEPGKAESAAPIADIAVSTGQQTLSLARRGITTIVWATGYRRAYPWLRTRVGALDEHGELVHRHGVTPVRGLYAVGLRFQRRRNSHTIGGVGDDATFVAGQILGNSEAPLRVPRREHSRRLAATASLRAPA